jgi:ribonuclease BN (tRNA processing enzyme)
MYNIIQSGSDGNSVIYFDTIMLDCGVPFAAIKPHLDKISLVLLTHVHGDHFNIGTIKRMAFERPSLRFGCGEFLVEHLHGVRNVDVYQAGKLYDYRQFKVSPVILYHDCKSFGYRIFKGDKKIFHATDTCHLDGITAKGYSLYALEANYDEDTVWDIIREKESRGEYAHQRGSINSHLSQQQAQDFVLKNAVGDYEFIMLHQSKSAF